jgi:hypothetical protein
MNPNDVTVATMTWVREEQDGPILRRSLQALSGLGLSVTVADRGTSHSFSEFLRSLPRVHVIEPSEPGLIGQVAAALEHAATFGTRFIVYSEPDKETFFTRHLSDFLRAAPDESDVGAVIASRSAAGFATFPRIQRYTETVVNDLCAEMIGGRGDFTYGPFVMARAVVPDARQLDGALGWGWRPFVFRRARRLGLRIAHVEGDYTCPSEQYVDDEQERIHRLRQLRENILGLIA